MQALQRRQHKPYSQPSFLPSPPSPHLTLADQLQQATLSGNTDLYNQELLNSYLESQQASFAQTFIVGDDLQSDPSQYMSSAFDLANPSIRIQQSTPTPQLTAFSQPPSMLSATNATASGLNNWGSFAHNNGQLDSQSLHAPSPSRSSRTHQRAASSSSIGSNGSHYQPTGHGAGFSYVAHSENLPSSSAGKLDSSYGADQASRAFSSQHHLPTPSQTPTQDSFAMNSNYPHYTPNVDSTTMAAHLSMKQALMDQHVPDDEVPGFAHSARHSVSSYGHDSPATPHTTHGDDFEDRFKVPPSGETAPSKVETWFDEYLHYDDESDLRNTVPKFERTYTDAAIDELYNPSLAAQIPHSTPQSSRPTNLSLLSPYGNSNSVVKNALRAAENARSQSPASSASRGVSPFRASYAGSNAFSSPRVRVGTVAEVREQQKAEADAYAMRVPPSEEPQPKTISPKDALLDYNGEADDDSKGPLFPDGGASEYEHQYNGGDPYRNTAQSSFDTTSAQNYRRDNWSTPQFSPQFSASSGPSSQTSFSFAPPSIQGNLHGLSSYSPQQYRTMPAVSEPTPDFPAHLTSMESSASEAEPVTIGTSGEPLQRPAGTTADTGTYTCTYHGCTLRFETPQKLQKHKREGHRNANPANVGNGMTSAQLLERNSQAGPHKCERINPTTGKPCNTIFSRPYDLTRHEDTIHNARKQKVRCALCVEEKTFSRNDALTRHMRVVHPEVDFPGKHRRRGGNHD